ncbi:MAG: bacillithiol system redox-active protein YtxJ [Bacteroidota bacterium]
MSLFKNFFGNESEEPSSKINWIALNNLGQLNEIINTSAEKPVIIFKHSTRCSVSRMALKQFENDFDIETLQYNIATYFLDLLNYRDISNEIASRFNVQHQSPQLILIKNGLAVYNVSHSDIDAGELKSKV